METDKNNEFELFRSNSNEESSSKSQTKPVLLVIDDDLYMQEAFGIAFGTKYEIISCMNGNDGVDRLNSIVSVVVLDIKMEGKNGFETFIEIKKINSLIPIIFYSAYQDIKSPFEIMNDYRPFGYVIKGGEGKELLHTIESAIDYYQQIIKNTELVGILQNRNEVLLELQGNLEKIVETRTEELTLANIELHKEINVRQKAENAIKSLLEEKEIILKEVHHRIKNNMLTLKALLNLQAGTLKEPTAIAALVDAGNRVQSMMFLYEKLYQSVSFHKMSIQIYLPPLVEQIVKIFPNSEYVKVENNIDDFILDAKRLLTLGIMFNELLTNIMKYAFTERKNGLIIVEAHLKPVGTENDKLVTIIIWDNGIGISESVDFENSTGFGLMLVNMLTKQLKGTLQIVRENGTKIILEFLI